MKKIKMSMPQTGTTTGLMLRGIAEAVLAGGDPVEMFEHRLSSPSPMAHKREVREFQLPEARRLVETLGLCVSVELSECGNKLVMRSTMPEVLESRLSPEEFVRYRHTPTLDAIRRMQAKHLQQVGKTLPALELTSSEWQALQEEAAPLITRNPAPIMCPDPEGRPQYTGTFEGTMIYVHIPVAPGLYGGKL
jgi:hypothetical protein